MITPETIEVSVTYGHKLTFFLKMIGLVEEQQLRQKSFGVADDEKAVKEYELNVQILKDLSVKKPIQLVSGEEKGDEIDLDTLFGERTPTSERIAFYAVRAYFMRLLPAESFF
jgi:hypothetical protein